MDAELNTNTFCLKWSDYPTALSKCLSEQRNNHQHMDVELVCTSNEREFESPKLGGFSLLDKCPSQPFKAMAHKLVLSACSPFFYEIFTDDEFPTIVDVRTVILPREIGEKDLKYLMGFIYEGHVEIQREDVESFFQAADVLHIKGINPYQLDNRFHLARFLSQKSETKRVSKRKSLPKKVQRCEDFDCTRSNCSDSTDRPSFYEDDDMVGEDSNQEIKHEEDLKQKLCNLSKIPRSNLRPPSTEDNPLIIAVNNGTTFESRSSTRSYTKEDMEKALDALKEERLTLTRASEAFGIPATTLWQRANRMGIATPKKETANKTWSDEDMSKALDALRKRKISANKAAKIYKIPSSTLYKIARKEKIELAQPFNAVATSWKKDDLDQALEAIKNGTPVLKAASEFGIPSGTLYGRCKKVGIELSKTTTVHWSEEAMKKALKSVQSGVMSINQAAIHHNLPYSSLYGRINKWKRENEDGTDAESKNNDEESHDFGGARDSGVDWQTLQGKANIPTSLSLPVSSATTPSPVAPSALSFMVPYLSNLMAAQQQSQQMPMNLQTLTRSEQLANPVENFSKS